MAVTVNTDKTVCMVANMIGEKLCVNLSLSYSWRTCCMFLGLNTWGMLLTIRFVMIITLIESSGVCLLELMFTFVVSLTAQCKLN